MFLTSISANAPISPNLGKNKNKSIGSFLLNGFLKTMQQTPSKSIGNPRSSKIKKGNIEKKVIDIIDHKCRPPLYWFQGGGLGWSGMVLEILKLNKKNWPYELIQRIY
ncbi:unnamed protein product [Meganyctiphanes norvegica]|uniref:Uncharacterized protein n=1 Tax=Meganyctiphanes norvegica TaxID=48144 RepID=A0AAV2R243_MEGNR